MTPRQIVEYYGDGVPAQAAKALGLTRQAIAYWLRTNRAPSKWQYWCERDSGGRLKADKGRPR